MTDGRRWEHGSKKYLLSIISKSMQYAAPCYHWHWLAGVQGGARSQLAASGSVSPRQWRPGAGTEAGLHRASQHCWGYVTNSVSVFSMFMATHSHYSLLLFSVANCAHLLWRKFKSQKKFHNFWHWFLALFTKPIKNWGVPEMVYCEILLWSKICRWNRVKMVQNGPKMTDIIFGISNMININIFDIFSFFNLFLWILIRPCI